MPVKKFKTFEEAERDLWVFNPDKEYYEHVKRMFEFWDKLPRKKVIPGIQKLKTFEPRKYLD